MSMDQWLEKFNNDEEALKRSMYPQVEEKIDKTKAANCLKKLKVDVSGSLPKK